MGGTESVKEVYKRNFALDGAAVGDRSQVHDFLYTACAEECETGLAACIDIRMITEDRKRV